MSIWNGDDTLLSRNANDFEVEVNTNGAVKTSESWVDEHLPVWHYMAQEIQLGFSVKQVGFLHWSGKPQPLARSAIIVSDAMKEERMLSFKHHFVRTAGFKLGMLRHIKVRCMVIGKPI